MSHASPSRSGNTLIIALGVVVIVSGIVFVSSTHATQVLRDQEHGLRQTQAAAALEAVLSRREAMLVDLASTGEVLSWTGDTADQPPNFGVDVVGECTVRWRIEPARTVRDEDLTGTTNARPYLENPSPENTYVSNDTKRLENGFVFMYRIAAQATCKAVEDEGSLKAVTLNRQPGRAEGARFVAVSKLPMLRYVINYLRNGAAGDLELSHNPAVTIGGNVNSNGAIYIGSGTMVGDWAASGGGSGATTIGPRNGVPVIVKGNDGIFRLSKPTMYSALNQLPMSNGPTLGPIDVSPSSPYFDVSSALFPADPVGLSGGNFTSVTRNGRYLNPYRVKAGAGTATMVTGGSVQRTVNNIPIQGGIDAPANDSRDAGRAADRKFPILARAAGSDGFQGYAQTQESGSRPEKLAEQYKERALEPQQLHYREADGDPLTDEHDFAVPVFEKPADVINPLDPAASDTKTTTTENLTTAAMSAQAAGINPKFSAIEQPGSYLKLMLKDMRMSRLNNGEGWEMTGTDGAPLPGLKLLDGKENHLVIRERPLPRASFWPASGDPTKFIPFGDPDALPYAPGKHWRPVSMPFTPIDVVENLYTQANSSAWTNIASDPNDRNSQTDSRSVAYRYNGQLSMVSATGVNRTSSNYVMQAAYTGGLTPGSQTYPRADEYYNGTWRFVHLKNRYGLTDAEILSSPLATSGSLRYSFWLNNNRHPTQAAATGNPSDAFNRAMDGGGTPEHAPFVGTPTKTGFAVGGAINDRPWSPGLATPEIPTTSNSNDFFSIRWEGFLVPPATGDYAFRVKADDGYRVWLDDRLASERWAYAGGYTDFPIVYSYTQNKPVKIVIEMYEVGGGNEFQIQWRPPLGSFQNIPSSALRAPAAGVAGGFNRNLFTSVVARIDPAVLNGPAQQKVGLMLRAANSEPDMLSTRDRYIALCYSPARGIFLERRMDESRHVTRLSTAKAFWIGSGSYTVDGGTLMTVPTSGASSGVLSTPIAATGTAYDPLEVSGPIHNYSITRTATLTRTALTTPTAGTPSRSDNTSFNQTGGTNPATQNQNLGDGVSVDVKFGPWTKVGSKTRTITKRITASRTYTFTFSGTLAFPTALVGSARPNFTLYNPTSTATTSSVYTTLGGYTLTGTPSGRSFTVPQSQDVTTTASLTTGSIFSTPASAANKIWKPSGGWPSGYTAASFVQKLKDINFQGRNDWVLGENNGDGPSDPVGTVTLADPPDPVPATLPVIYDTLAHSFALDSTPAYSLEMDTNPWITANGWWAASPVALKRPFNSLWTGTYGIQPPLTSSIRPDQGVDANQATAILVNAPWAAGTPGGSVGRPITSPITAMADDLGLLPVGVMPKNVWLRITRNPATNVLTFAYAHGNLATAPATASPSWLPVATGNPVSIASADWANFLCGPCVQSGNSTVPTSITFNGLSVSTTEAMGPLASPYRADGVWNYQDWDSNSVAGPGSPMSRYLASQYQVFFGGAEITEDFFTWADQQGGGATPIATEDWFYNPREFWSQGSTWQTWDSATGYSSSEPWGVPAPSSRWLARGWRDTALKDGDRALMNEKKLWAKTTVLQLDLARLWDYLTTRRIDQAMHPVLGLGTAAPLLSADPLLSNRFAGGIYIARTNRYPFNPNQPLTNPAIDLAPLDLRLIGGTNPWSFSTSVPYPNGVDVAINPSSPLANDTHSDRAIVPPPPMSGAPVLPYSTYTWNDPLLRHSGVHKLQPYDQMGLFPIRPQQFHHGVLLTNGKNINWGIKSDGTSSFGDGKVSFITPNALYIQGDFNSQKNPVKVGGLGAPVLKDTPVMVNGDSVTLLSNAWKISNYKSPALTIGWDASKGKFTPTSGGVLAFPTDRNATNTTYVAGIITHNQPTTRERVLEGQSSPFIDTMQFIENWAGTTMTFRGSLVVLDTRRYTDSFLLDGGKDNGRSPFGWMGWVATKSLVEGGRGLPLSEWIGLTPKVYAAGTRDFQYQADFLTKDGTPPLAPYGMTASGIGGWSRILE